jgi:hypothetical protein
MQFDRAMSLLLAGYPVTRAGWNGRETADGTTIHRSIVPSAHGFIFEGRRTIYGREQEFSNALVLSSADLAADDWSAVAQTALEAALSAPTVEDKGPENSMETRTNR